MTNNKIAERLREILEEIGGLKIYIIDSCMDIDALYRVLQEDLDGSALESLRDLILELEKEEDHAGILSINLSQQIEHNCPIGEQYTFKNEDLPIEYRDKK